MTCKTFNDGPGSGGKKTCDAPICDKHAKAIAKDKDLCPACHAKRTPSGLATTPAVKVSPRPKPSDFIIDTSRLSPEEYQVVYRRSATMRIPFGQKFRGMIVDDIAKTDDGLLYLDWGRDAWTKWDRPPVDIIKAINVYLSDPSISKELNTAVENKRSRRRDDRAYLDSIAR